MVHSSSNNNAEQAKKAAAAAIGAEQKWKPPPQPPQPPPPLPSTADDPVMKAAARAYALSGSSSSSFSSHNHNHNNHNNKATASSSKTKTQTTKTQQRKGAAGRPVEYPARATARQVPAPRPSAAAAAAAAAATTTATAATTAAAAAAAAAATATTISKPRLIWPPPPSVGTVVLPAHNRAAAAVATASTVQARARAQAPARAQFPVAATAAATARATSSSATTRPVVVRNGALGGGAGSSVGMGMGMGIHVPIHVPVSAPAPLSVLGGGVGVDVDVDVDEPLPLVPNAGLVRGHDNINMGVDESAGGAAGAGDLDDYAQFVKSLGLDDHWDDWKLPDADDDDEEEFLLEAMEDDDDDEDDDDGDGDGDDDGGDGGEESGGEDLDDNDQAVPKLLETQTTKDVSKEASSAMELDLLEWDPNFYQELEEELGGLEEEDMEAAVATLLDHTKKRNDDDEIPAPDTDEGIGKTDTEGKKVPKSASSSVDQQGAPPNTPLRDAARASRTVVTTEQFEQLHSLMNQHYQLLTQQAVLSVRAAHYQKTHKTREQIDYVTGGETGDDLVEILDGAVGMLQDLDQNRKDSIRNSIQFETAQAPARRSLLPEMDASEELNQSATGTGQRRLTRAQFIKTLQKHTNGQQRTVFDIQGLSKLKETFAMVDKSVEGVRKGDHNHNILEMSSNAEACRQVLDQAEAVYDKNALPGVRDASVNFCDAREFLGATFVQPCTLEQDLILRRNRNLFTSGEDNLVFRGVNLYGEKQWILIADRYLPDRSINIISQRYSKLCVMLYKAHDIEIDVNGNLIQPPRLESVDDLDEKKVGTFKKVAPPAILNVHRWSLEEDLTLLIAVPHMGHMWAELGARLIPHRDRGHLRKRYQVLERRVKASVTRTNKHETLSKLAARYGSPLKSPLKSPVKAVRPVGVRPHPKSIPLASTVSSKTVNQAAAILANAKMAPVKPPPPKQPAHQPPQKPQRSLIQPPKRPPTQPSQKPFQSQPLPLAQKPLQPQPLQPAQKHLPLQRPPQQPEQKPLPPQRPSQQSAHKPLPLPYPKQKPESKKPPRRLPQPHAQHTHQLQQAHPPQQPHQVQYRHQQLPQYPHQQHHPHQLYHYPQEAASYRMHSFNVGPVDPPSAHPQPYPNQALHQHNEEGSREAFEDLVQGYEGDWSQMSRMQKMMENDTESMVANAIVSQLAKSPAKPQHDRGALSGHFGDNDDDNNGFSMLDTYGSSPAKAPRAEGVSFLDGVLERTRQGDPPRASDPGDAAAMKPPPVGPSTPNRHRTFSTSTTPTKFSPGFRPGGMLPPSASKYNRSPGISVDSFTAGAVSKMLADSPAANSSSGNSMVGYNLSGVFDMSDHSQQASEGGDRTPRASPTKTPTRPLFGDDATLMENDLEAISALNSLSNSPAIPLLKRPASSMDRPEDGIGGGGESRQSLFATVIGGVKEKESRKKKLKF